jgi:glycogen debranching enzyme
MFDRLAAGLSRRWRPPLACFVSRDLVSGEDVEAPTQAGFMPLLALGLDEAQRRSVEDEIRRWCAGMVVGLPSTAPFSPAFEPKRYWRGPVWAVVNWLISDGLRANGLDEMAGSLEQGTLEAIERAGFCEYFDPTTGEGLGGDAFSWTAAAYLVLASRRGAGSA